MCDAINLMDRTNCELLELINTQCMFIAQQASFVNQRERVLPKNATTNIGYELES